MTGKRSQVLYNKYLYIIHTQHTLPNSISQCHFVIFFSNICIWILGENKIISVRAPTVQGETAFLSGDRRQQGVSVLTLFLQHTLSNNIFFELSSKKELGKFYAYHSTETTIFSEHNNHSSISKNHLYVAMCKDLKLLNLNSDERNNLCVAMYRE